MYPHGGYKTQTVVQIGNILAAFNQGRISLRGLRLYFAALAAVAAREAAKRSRQQLGRRPAVPTYLAAELARLCDCRQVAVRRELRALERVGLLQFGESEIIFTAMPLPGSEAITEALAGGRSELRPVPLPRPALRFIARCGKVSTIKTMLAYCVRGLSLTRDGQVKGKGTAKASWISEACGVSLRAVRVARAELIAVGFITRDECSTQWKLNRHGAYFAVNMTFGERRAAAVDNSDPHARCFAPLPGQECISSAPPYKDMKTPCGSENQKTRNGEQAGFCGQKELRKPKLSDVQREDLRSVSRMLALHGEAKRVGLAQDSEAGRLAFLAAAVHAARVANRNAAGLFATIVRKGLWHFVTLDDEERARRSLHRWRSTQLSPVIPAPDESRQLRTSRPLPLSASPILNGILSKSGSSPEAASKRPAA